MALMITQLPESIGFQHRRNISTFNQLFVSLTSGFTLALDTETV